MAAVRNYPMSPPPTTYSDEMKPDYHPPAQVHTPPTTDEGSHKDDDAASSSSLSDLDDDLDLEPAAHEFTEDDNRKKFEDAARAGAEAERHAQIKPHHFEGGIPVFQPNMDEFKDFQAFMTQVDGYGMQSGIIKIIPPPEWKAARKPLDDLVKHIKIKNPITQEFHGAQGIYTQRNMERLRTYNLPQWKSICEQTENQPPAKRGEKRLNADKLLGRGTARKNKIETTPQPENGNKRGRSSIVKCESTDDRDATVATAAAPLTPTSPEARPIVVKQEEDNDVQSTRSAMPTRGRGGRKGRAGRARGPKREPAAKNTETTVAARRLRNAREVNDVVDEEAFHDFDYRVHDNDQWTQERCDELEDKYWKSLNFSNPMYAADMPGSLFDADTTCWNVAKLPNLLDWLGAPIPGVNTAYLYLGMWRATFAWHLEDVDLYSINYIHFGAPKQWYSISQKDAPKFENAMKSLWPQDAKDCDQFLRHKTYLVSPSLLKSKFGVTVNKIVHREGEFVVTYPIGYHSGYNLGYNCAESVNFAIENWLQYGKTARKCQCESDSVFIDVNWFVRRMNGEPSPEYEEVEITDDEEEDDHGTNTPAPSEAGRRKSNKRKRPSKEMVPNKKAKKMVRIRKVSRNQPCVLCPNDFAWEELLPTSNGQRAHRVCAMYTPETYIATEEGREKVYNVENVSKARLELRCHECKQKKGSCFQCSSAKCTRAYHATCAMYAGVQVDKGDIAVWHEGVEYRDVGFDWRCKLHRTVKRHRITSESSLLNHALSWLSNRELHEHIIALQPGDVIQWQPSNGDEIQAGLVMAAYDHGQNSLLVSVLPDQKTVREVDPAWLLFVDSSTSCLQRPSPTALALPEELQGKTAQGPAGAGKKPSEGDPFTEHPKTEWAEFVVEDPPHNSWQKPVDLTKEKQIFYFLGQSSTDTKAQYTADPARPVHDPAANFLDTVEPPKMPPPQPKRHSLATPYPMMPWAVRNATIQNMRPPSLGPPRTPVLPKPDWPLPTPDYDRAAVKPSHYRDHVVVAEAKANADARLAQRHPTLSVTANTVGMGIDQAAVARQKQFQHHAAQQSKSMTGQSYGPTTASTVLAADDCLAGYRNAYTPQNYYPGGTNQSFNHNFYRPHSSHTTDWLHPPGQHPGVFSPIPSPAMPMMETNSPELSFNKPAIFTQSPTHMSTTTFPSDTTNNSNTSSSSNNTAQNTGYPFLGVSAAGSHVSSGTSSTTTTNSLKRPARSMEARHSRTTSLVPLRAPMETERQRRISNPCYPFKSPQQIVASKEEQERNGSSQSSGSRTVSRPGSGYSTTAFPSPAMHAAPFGPILQPMMYINPTATQLSSPMSAPASSHARAKSASMSAGVNNMGPPMHPSMPPFRRSLSSSSLAPIDSELRSMTGINFKQEPDFSSPIAIPDNLRTHASSLSSNMNPMLPPPSNRSRRSTLGTSSHPSMLSNISGISMTSPLLAPQCQPAPIAYPSAPLEQTLTPRPQTRSGTPTNDRPLPPALIGWQSHPGFWGKVATYFSHKHENAATVYKSPFAATNSYDMAMHGASGIGHDDGLAGRWLNRLEGGQRLDLGMWLGSHPMGMRP